MEETQIEDIGLKETSKNKNLKLGILLCLSSALLGSLGQLVWKFGADSTENYSLFLYILGFVISGVAMLVMMIAFRYGDVSILQPMGSINIVLPIFFGALFLNESITWQKLLGVVVVMGGVVLLGTEKSEGKE